MVLKLSINKELLIVLISHVISLTFHLSVLKASEPEGEQLCIAVYTINNNICDANPLDNSHSKAQIKWHCLTQYGASSRIPRMRQEIP